MWERVCKLFKILTVLAAPKCDVKVIVVHKLVI